MIASTQITNTNIFAFMTVPVSKLLSPKVLVVNTKDNRKKKEKKTFSSTAKSHIFGMRSFQDTFETRKQSFISAFLMCMTVPLNFKNVSLLKYACIDRS